MTRHEIVIVHLLVLWLALGALAVSIYMKNGPTLWNIPIILLWALSARMLWFLLLNPYPW